MSNCSIKENGLYEICFVQTDQDLDKVSENLKLAFDAMDSNHMEPIWIKEEDCFKCKRKEPKLFVIDPFETKAFDHLKSSECRIVGPLCILYCLNFGEKLPKRPYPLFSVAMRRLSVSCSNINTSQREQIAQQVELMGGFFSKDLTKSVTHLIVGEVGSKKYQVAANLGLPIMLPEWIEDVWLNGQHKQMHGTDGSYNRYKCPIFKGLVITVSQLGAQERSEIQALIEDNGGEYLASLKAQKTTHLVLSDPTGDKYRYANTWKIFCININWICDSIEAGFCKDEKLYEINNSSKRIQPQRSTPNKDKTSCEFPLVDCSAITNTSVVSHLDETIRSEISFPTFVKKSPSIASLDSFDLATLPKYGQFLDGCKIYLTGFNPMQVDKLRKVVNSGGGIRFSKYSDSISHVICGNLTEEFLQCLKSSTIKPFILNADWLLECCKNEKLVDEKPFLCMENTLMSPEKASIEPPAKKHSAGNSSIIQSQTSNNTPENITDIFKQYMNNDDTTIKHNSEKATSSIHQSEMDIEQRKMCEPLENNLISVNDNDENMTANDISELFVGYMFCIVGYGVKDTEILQKMIEEHSGTIVSKNDTSANLLTIVPLIWHDEPTGASHILTNCWLQKCIEDSCIYAFDENELFYPIAVAADKKPFENFVISVSQYSGTERDCLMHLMEELGATCQEYFVRKANKSRGILSNTHLVVATPEGSKYEAAKKWKIPAVSKQWVIDAAKSGTTPSVDNYLIDGPFAEIQQNTTVTKKEFKETVSIESKENINENCALGASKNLTPRCVSSSVSDLKTVTPQVNMEKEPLNISHVKNAPEDQTKVMSRTITQKIIEDKLEKTLSPLLPIADISKNETFNLDKSYKHKFRISGLLNDLDSSTLSQEQNLNARRQSIPVDEIFSKNLASAVRGMSSRFPSYVEEYKNSVCETPGKKKPLSGIVIYVAKKLSHLQSELHEIVGSLGGEYIFTYDDSCTHFIFTGKQNDLTKEFREAKTAEKHIVSPDWVFVCKENLTCADEKQYPHTLKANMTLNDKIAVVKTHTVRKTLPKITTPVNVGSETPNDKIADFNRELNDLLVAAKSAKKRQSRRLLNSSSNTPTNISPIQKAKCNVSDSYFKPMSHQGNSDDQDAGSQQSQSCPIVWDDPTGRLEREKIAALTAVTVKTIPELNPCVFLEDSKYVESVANVSIAGIANNVHPQKVKKFIFTNIPETQKKKFIEIVNELGGSVSDEKSFDITCTHLIVEKPTKNEKLLSSVASGKWVLHPQYLLTSLDEKRFVDEEDYEWGGNSASNFSQKLTYSTRKIANCPHRWRVKLNQGGQPHGAFHDWKVVVYAEDKAKLFTYLKILQAGEAEIISQEKASSMLSQISFVIVDMKKSGLSNLDLGPFIANNIKCIRPEYLGFYLTEESPPSLDNFIIPEMKEMPNDSAGTSKRRNLSLSSRSSKRTRMS